MKRKPIGYWGIKGEITPIYHTRRTLRQFLHDKFSWHKWILSGEDEGWEQFRCSCGMKKWISKTSFN